MNTQHYLISHLHKYIACFVPRCGSETVCRWCLANDNIPATEWPKKNIYEFCRQRLGLGSQVGFVFDPTYFKFVIVRNPYTRILSAYLERISTDLSGFDSFVRKHIHIRPDQLKDVHWRPQYVFLQLVKFDYIGHMESFEEDMKIIAGKVGLNVDGLLHKNRQPTADLFDTAYTQELKDIVYELYRRDFEMLGYPR